ncbi:MAG: DUF952 domain-containing protein [Pseudomonadota bacterium]
MQRIMHGRLIYKILKDAEWREAQDGGPVEAPLDRADGYVHFSTVETLQSTLSLHFKGVENAVLLSFYADDFGDDLKWEPARGGTLFPHVYRRVSADEARQTWRLDMGSDGAPEAPREVVEV